MIPLQSGTKQHCSLSLYLIDKVLEFLARAIRQQKESEEIQGRKEVKLSIFADNMRVYISDPKNSTKELLQLLQPSITAGYKIK